MRVSDSHKMLFVHVQKTGGNSIEAVLSEHIHDLRVVDGKQDRHEGFDTIVRREPDLANYWAFGFVRNPWARMVSWWQMVADFRDRAEAGNPRAAQRIRKNPFWAATAQYPDFDTFVNLGPEEWDRLRKPQIDYLTGVDFIGQVETFDADMATVLDRLGLPRQETPRRNVSSHAGRYRDFYTPATRERVAELFAKDADEFGYRF